MSQKTQNLIDTHAHLTFPDFDEDRGDVYSRARDEGVEYIICVGSGEGIEGNGKAVELARQDERIYATVGVHPHDAEHFDEKWLSELISMISEEEVVAIGETGLDYHRMHASPELQQKCFRSHLKLAHQYDKPIIIHDRDAHEDIWKIIQEEGVPASKGVFHCFSGDLAFAEKVVEAGFFISIPGIVTYPSANDLRGVAASIPLENMMFETDCPYLAPQRFRGKRNEPAYVREVAKEVANLKGLAETDVARVTTLNAKRLFRLPGAALEPRIAYRIRNSLYLNLTNRCNLKCTFCSKHSAYEVKGYFLRLPREPDIEQVFQAMGHPEQYDEVVFCGFGEPTKRLELVKEVARRMKMAGVKRVRLNTDGLANLVYGRNVTEELGGLIDAVSVSLNAHDGKTYAHLCPSSHGDKEKFIPEVVATVVLLPEVNVDRCRKVAEEELGVSFKVRSHKEVG
jgi:TatD DNase family protein